MKRAMRLISIVAAGAWVLTMIPAALGQTGTDVYAGDWPTHHGNELAQRYSPLDQINADNVGSLQIAWRYSTANIGPQPEFNATFTPLEVDGVMYTTMGATRNIAALDATNGQLLWLWRPQEGERFDAAPRKGSGRGISYYRFGDERRIITVTPGFFLVSLDAETGIPDPNFGDNGWVDMFEGLRLPRGREDVDIGSSMPPFIMNDVVVGRSGASGFHASAVNVQRQGRRARLRRADRRIALDIPHHPRTRRGRHRDLARRRCRDFRQRRRLGHDVGRS